MSESLINPQHTEKALRAIADMMKMADFEIN
jgi:hypothetical protein